MAKIIGNTTATPNPRPDWNQIDSTKADYIKNKPSILTEEDVINLIAENGGGSGGGVAVDQVQADWSQTDNTKVDYIKNKPEGLATENYVDTHIAALVDTAPEELNTFKELADALGNNPNLATDVLKELNNKVNKEEGKGLSTNDYSDEEKEKLAGLKNIEIVDDLISTDKDKALSANQGVELFNTIGGVATSLQDQLVTVDNKLSTHSNNGDIHFATTEKADMWEILQSNMKQTSYLPFDEVGIVLNNNFLIICEDPLTSLTITMPNIIPEIYNCEFTFASGETATNLNYSSTPIIWRGDDCDDEGAFIPETNTTYEVSVKNLGVSGIVARVGKI